MTRLLDLWQGPEGAGDAVGCFATSFTFDTDFFVDDCLTRFLGLTRVQGEGDNTSDVARMLDEEDRLSEAAVCVLVDRSCVPDKRNLRWDLLTVALGRGRLLHAKVAVLLWEHHTRVLIGSANLTPAGYRSQIETVTALDLGPDCGLPESLLRSLASELRDILAAVPGDQTTHARGRAGGLLDLFEERISAASLPSKRRSTDPRLALAVTKPGASPLDGFKQVWSGGPPRDVVLLSPFWDKDSDARRAVLQRLAQRGAVTATFVVSFDPRSNVVRAPATLLDDLPERVDACVVALGALPDSETEDPRLLHAKCIRFESDDWVAAMVGSANITKPGLGLTANGHREVNLWIGCAADSPTAEALRLLIPEGDGIELADMTFEDPSDEDEVDPVPLPASFVDALLCPGIAPALELTLDPTKLPEQWTVLDGDVALTDSDSWAAAGSPAAHIVDLRDRGLVSTLDVTWSDGDAEHRAPWAVNVSDPSLLPPPDELRGLSIEVLLAVLASTRPIHDALEAEMRRAAAAATQPQRDELDPLKMFDSERLLLTRTRRVAAALWGLQRRFDRPVASIDALEWRLGGIVGATQLADGFAASVDDGSFDSLEARFHLAELARTVGTIDWPAVTARLDQVEVRACVTATLEHIAACCDRLPSAGGALDAYVRSALRSVAQ